MICLVKTTLFPLKAILIKENYYWCAWNAFVWRHYGPMDGRTYIFIGILWTGFDFSLHQFALYEFNMDIHSVPVKVRGDIPDGLWKFSLLARVGMWMPSLSQRESIRVHRIWRGGNYRILLNTSDAMGVSYGRKLNKFEQTFRTSLLLVSVMMISSSILPLL